MRRRRPHTRKYDLRWSALWTGVVLMVSMRVTWSMSTTSTEAKPAIPYASIGKAISSVTSIEDTLELASSFWLPGDEGLPPHFSQKVHHETRQRWASQLLSQMARHSFHYPDSRTDQQESRSLMQQKSLARLLQAASTQYINPKTNEIEPDRVTKEGVWIVDSLQGIYGIVGRQLQHHPRAHTTNVASLLESTDVAPECLESMVALIYRAQALADAFTLEQACRAQWAIQGLKARVPHLQNLLNSESSLDERVGALPFQIIPLGVDWNQFLPDNSADTAATSNGKSSSDHICDQLLDVIPFSRDVITTRRGETVQERRGTAWIAEDGIGALAYSGKLMPPQPIPTVVRSIMRHVEDQLELTTSPNGYDASSKTGFFDCALCNHYADAGAACKFHTDPEHGIMWDRTTVVVAAGSDRTFAFKPIDTQWDHWDIVPRSSSSSAAAATTHLFAGDLVVMRDNCNDDFYHAVHAGETNAPRVSLVLKRGIGPRGHGLAGQGRRKRKRQKQQEKAIPKGKRRNSKR